MTISINLSPDAQRLIERLAAASEQTVESYLTVLIERGLEDAEDNRLASDTLAAMKAGRETTSPLDDVERRLRL